MPYLSKLIGRRVEDSADQKVGKLVDVLVSLNNGSYAPIEYLAIKEKTSGQIKFLPYKFVEVFSKYDISTNNLRDKLEWLDSAPKGALFLCKDVLDQQIVDITDAKVVRVNDLRFGSFDNRMCVLGIDVSWRGLLRRLGFEWLDFFNIFSVNLLDWRGAQPVKGTVKIDVLAKNLNKLHPADLANVVEDLHIKNGSRLVLSLGTTEAAKVLEEMDPNLQKMFLRNLDDEQAKNIINKMSVDEIVDLLKIVPKREAKKFMDNLQGDKSKQVKSLLKHGDNTAGGLMTTDYINVGLDWTVAEVLEEIRRRSPSMRSILYAYVSSGDGKFRGALSMRRLLVADQTQKVREILKKDRRVATLKVDDDLNNIIDMMTRYNLYSAAVLDETRHLLGIVTIDDVMRAIRPKA